MQTATLALFIAAFGISSIGLSGSSPVPAKHAAPVRLAPR
jgi:hypothetical protein